MKPEVDLELSISALRAYNVEPAVIKNMLDNLKKVVCKSRNLQPVSVALPEFLYEYLGEIKIGYYGDSVVTDEWNRWKEDNL